MLATWAYHTVHWKTGTPSKSPSKPVYVQLTVNNIGMKDHKLLVMGGEEMALRGIQIDELISPLLLWLILFTEEI